MRILVDCRPLQYDGGSGERARWILSCTRDLSLKYGVDWLYIMDKDGRDLRDLDPGAGTDGTRWVIKSSLPGKAGWAIWYDWQIPRLVKKYRPDRVMTTGGVAAGVKTPQISWMPEDLWMKGSGKGAKKGVGRMRRKEGAGKGLASLYRKRLTGSLQTARAIFCLSEDVQLFVKGILPAAGAETPVIVIPPVAGPAFAPQGIDDREKAKGAYAGGKEYFFTDLGGADEEEVVNLLRAFSRFKKRQLSNMQLVLAGSAGGSSGDVARAIDQRLETYKYRQDLHLFAAWSPAKDGPAMTGGAYAMVRPFGWAATGLSVVEAWKARVPVIATTTDAQRLKEDGTGTAEGLPLLVAAADDPGALAEKLMMIYKDESLRSSLVEKGAARAANLDWERSAAAIWEVLSGPVD